MKKYWCKHFVALRGKTFEHRRAAAEWALKHFDSRNIDIFHNDPTGCPGFYFESEKDAILFSLRWGAE